MKYKVGDKVVVKSRKWYDKNKDENGNVQMNFDDFVGPMAELCGKTVTISEIINGRYRIKEMCLDWYDDMFEDAKTLEITIPEWKTPKMTETENSCVIEWVDKEKTFADYLKEYSGYLKTRIGLDLNPQDPDVWMKEFKFGLLKYIADDLNEEKLDWKNKNQDKCELYYNTATGGIGYLDLNVSKYTSVHFTRSAILKAIDIIPVEFLKSF